jgi:biotin carboxylase
MPRAEVVLVLGSGARHYREYLLASAAATRRLWLLDAVPVTWQRPYLEGASVVDLLDAARLVPDVDALVVAARALATTREVTGVLTYDETLVVAAAHVAERLGVPGLTVAGAENCRNKQRTREVLTAAGVAQPGFAFVTSPEDAAAAASVFGYPVVVKPRGMGGSMGVIRVAAPEQLAAAFHVAEASSREGNPNYEGGALVEEFLDGPEISIDGALHEGDFRPVFVARKRIGLDPYCEEIGHTVHADDPLLEDAALREMLTEAHRALGVRNGITHTEVMLTARGPVIVEVNGRLGGDLIPYLGKLATGIDPARLAVDLAGGVKPRLTPKRRSCVGVRFLYPPYDGRVVETRLPGPAEVPGVVEANAMVEPGALLRLPPRAYLSRYAYVIAEGADPAACDARLDEAVTHASVTVAPE